jgi:hypothetical protein
VVVLLQAALNNLRAAIKHINIMKKMSKIQAVAASAAVKSNTNLVIVNILLKEGGDTIHLKVCSWENSAAADFAKLVRAKLETSSSLYSRRRRINSLEEKVCVLDPKELLVTRVPYETAEGELKEATYFVSGKILGVETRNLEEEASNSFSSLLKDSTSATLCVVDGKLVLEEQKPVAKKAVAKKASPKEEAK